MKKGYALKGGCRELEDLKGPEYSYLGKFARKHFLVEGHNTNAADILAGVSNAFGSIAQGAINYALVTQMKPPAEKKPVADAPKPAYYSPELKMPKQDPVAVGVEDVGAVRKSSGGYGFGTG